MIRLGLRARFFLYSNTVIAVTMALVTFFWTLHERRSQYESINKRGQNITEAMAVAISEALEQNDPGEESAQISRYMGEIIARNRDLVRLVLVARPDAVITHASDQHMVGRRLDPAQPSPLTSDGSPSSAEDDRQMLLVRTALSGPSGFLGTLAVGFSTASIEEQVALVARRAAAVAILLMLFNSALTALYVETLIRPILTLNETMKWAGRGDLSVRSVEHRGDEVGELSDGFNRMMDQLEASRDREKVQRAQLAHTEKMVAVGTLAAGVAHEVNNPLAGIMACLDNMAAHPEDREMRDRYLDLARDGLKRIERTVANLLNFSRQRDIRAEPTSINHNLRHVAELVGYQARRANVEVRFDLDQDQALVLADHFQMEQLFLNLVLNALGAMPQGGKLTLRTRVIDGQVVAEVSDTGTGIPEEIRERIFDPFFTTRDVGEGTGLGLAVSDSIVAAHGGILEVESRVGRGSTFRIRMAAMPHGEGA